jgi:hypothetical protein
MIRPPKGPEWLQKFGSQWPASPKLRITVSVHAVPVESGVSWNSLLPLQGFNALFVVGERA